MFILGAFTKHCKKLLFSYVLSVRLPSHKEQLGFKWMEVVKFYILMFNEICIQIFWLKSNKTNRTF
jgi:hypothetical protein